MSRASRFVVFVLSFAILTMITTPAADAQRRSAGGRHPTVRGGVVFVGGYFYDPFYGPYPWWPPASYPYPYFPMYDNRAQVRVLVTPKEAAVFKRGYQQFSTEMEVRQGETAPLNVSLMGLTR